MAVWSELIERSATSDALLRRAPPRRAAFVEGGVNIPSVLTSFVIGNTCIGNTCVGAIGRVVSHSRLHMLCVCKRVCWMYSFSCAVLCF